MRANVLVEPGVIEMREVPIPDPEPGGVVVKVAVALTCGTDLKAFLRGHPKFPTPTLFGHEFAGVVAKVGHGVTRFKEGDVVMSTHSAPCETCYYCQRGQENLCDTIMSTMALGAYAEYIGIPERIVRRNMYPKPEHLPYREAALMEPLACVVHGLENVTVREDDTVVILGNGAIALLHVAALRTRGVETIIVVGRRAYRQQVAQALGAAHTLDFEADTLPARIRDLTGGRGADLVIECTGQPHIWELAVQLARRGGTVIFFGGCKRGTTVTFDTERIHYDEITLRSPFHMTPRAVQQARQMLLERRVDWGRLITADYPLDRLGDALEQLQRGDCIKFAILP
ncbi:MAG: alcohol dehydrogenase catalytic domain-containing protein [Chloracidobacterium sp.]|nr:alcohol dehydrogenase catalytic domain-containing protein [Chloracidobacterium sp.]